MKKLKLIVMTVVLMSVFGTIIYIARDNKSENDLLDDVSIDLAQGTEAKSNTSVGVDLGTPFYYSEVFSEPIDEVFGISQIFYRYKDQFVRVIKNEDKIEFVTLEDGKKIAEMAIKDYRQNSVDISSDGFLWTVPLEENASHLSLQKRNLEGDLLETIVITDVEKMIETYPTIYVDQLRVQSNHIYVQVNENLYIYDMKGQLKYEHTDVSEFEVDQNGDYVINADGSELLKLIGCLKYNIEDGKEVFRLSTRYIEVMRFSEDYSKLILGCFDGTIRVINAQDGAGGMKLFEYGIDSSFLMDGFTHTDLIYKNNGELGVAVRNANNYEGKDSMLYWFDKTEGTRPKKEPTLVFTAPYRSNFMLEAIKRYELKYPEEHIEYDYYYNTYEEFLNNSEEYGKKLVLKIINNEVGDVIQTGGSSLSYWSLAQSDVLMDIEPMLKELSYYEDLNQSVLEGIRINGAIKALPVYYMFYQYEFNEQLGDDLGLDATGDKKWSEVLSWIPMLKEKSPSSAMFNQNDAKGNLLASILVSNMPDLVDLSEKTVNLDQQWFKDLLNQYKEIAMYDNLELGNAAFDRSDLLQGALMRPWHPTQYVKDELHYYGLGLESKTSKFISGFVGEQNNNRIGYSKYMYSINQRTDQPEKAWQFLSFLVTEDIQKLNGWDGVPLNKKALNTRIEEAEDKIQKNPSLQEKWVEPYLENAKKIDFLYDMDYMKMDIINEIERFVADEITLEEALKNAEKKIIIRLNE